MHVLRLMLTSTLLSLVRRCQLLSIKGILPPRLLAESLYNKHERNLEIQGVQSLSEKKNPLWWRPAL